MWPFLKIGEEIWELDREDNIKNKYPAEKIKIQNDKIKYKAKKELIFSLLVF